MSKKTKTARRRVTAAPEPVPPAFTAHPFRLYRPKRLAELFDVDRATIYRWRQSGVLPPFVEFGGVGAHEQQLQQVQQQREVAEAER